MKFIQTILTLALALFITVQATSQIAIAYYDQELFTAALTDTLVDTEQDIYLWENFANFPHQAIWRIDYDSISGTPGVTVVFQESQKLNPSTSYPHTDWYTTKTVSLSGSGSDTTHVFSLSYGRRARCVVTGSGTAAAWVRPTLTIRRQTASY